MSLGANVHQILVLTVLATLTTVITTSLTYFLLSRPWCMQFDTAGGQTILYGADRCGDRPTPHPSSHSALVQHHDGHID